MGLQFNKMFVYLQYNKKEHFTSFAKFSTIQSNCDICITNKMTRTGSRQL